MKGEAGGRRGALSSPMSPTLCGRRGEMSAVRRLSGGRNKGCGGARVLKRETTRGRVTTSEYIEVEVAGHRYFIEHLLPSERTQELWVVSRDDPSLIKKKVFTSKEDMLKHYPNLRCVFEEGKETEEEAGEEGYREFVLPSYEALREWCKARGYLLEERGWTGIFTKDGKRIGSHYRKTDGKGGEYRLVVLYG